jgi:hypothetical protein
VCSNFFEIPLPSLRFKKKEESAPMLSTFNYQSKQHSKMSKENDTQQICTNVLHIQTTEANDAQNDARK